MYAYPEANQWAYLVIQTSNAVPHPIHIHGQLAQADSTFNTDTTTLTLTGGPRCDVALLPPDGYVVIAFYTDKPGVGWDKIGDVWSPAS